MKSGDNTVHRAIEGPNYKMSTVRESPMFHIDSWIFNWILTDLPQSITRIGTERVSTVMIQLTDWVIHGGRIWLRKTRKWQSWVTDYWQWEHRFVL